MKNIILIALLFASNVQLFYAGVITVDNNLNSPALYTTITDAVVAATSGDTILVVGSPYAYAGSIINDKEIHIIGAGFTPDKQNPYSSVVSGLQFGVVGSPFPTTSAGSSIEGCLVNGVFSCSGAGATDSLNSITIKRNHFVSNFSINQYCNNIVMYNNIFVASVALSNGTISNIIFSNNILKNSIAISNAAPSVLVTNNLFINTTGFQGVAAGSNAIFSNNIFYGASPNLPANYTTFNNNVSFGTSNDTFIITGTNSGSGNLEAVNPQFVSESNFTYTDTDDYNLQAGSPAILAGTDGTDIGIYGGAYPWQEGGVSLSGFMYGQEAQIPQVNQMNVQNTIVPLNGTLNVQVKGIINH